MELTIEQVLHQGVTAHKEGKLQEAERLYRTILQSQPLHPDANHNLGVIAVSVNKAEAALPLFKTALEANPKIEQFWLSYIDALIKEKQSDNAKQVLEQAKKEGLSGNKVDALDAQLKQITQAALPKSPEKKKSLTLKEKHRKIAKSKQQKKQVKSKSANDIGPSQSQLDNLLEHYKNGRYNEAEKLALIITQKFPTHQFSWKVLGVVLKQSGRVRESLVPSQKAATLSPQHAANHYNLGNTLKELGRVEESVASYRQAIVLKPDYYNAHNNLGNALQELGKLKEAVASFRQAIVLKPDYYDAHNNLGATSQALGRLGEAETSYKQAIAFKPDYANAYSNLGVTLKMAGRLEEALASFRQAIAIKPDYADAYNNLGIAQYINGDTDSALGSMKKANSIDPKFDTYELLYSVIQGKKAREETEVNAVNVINSTGGLRLTNNPLILNRLVERELITTLLNMNSRGLDQTEDARYGSGRCSSGFNLFQEHHSIINTVAEDLIRIMMDSVKSDVFVADSFFNILSAGGGSTPHNHLKELDCDHGLYLGRQKYSLVYYLSVGDQDCSEPGTLKLFDPTEDILPCEGMILIIPADRNHSAVYSGKTDRVMIGVNFYSL